MFAKKFLAVLVIGSMAACSPQQDLQEPSEAQDTTVQNAAVLAGFGVLLSILLVQSFFDDLDEDL